MDYARFNYIAQPEDKDVCLTPPVLGTYDYYAIKWGYTVCLLYTSSSTEAACQDTVVGSRATTTLQVT